MWVSWVLNLAKNAKRFPTEGRGLAKWKWGPVFCAELRLASSRKVGHPHGGRWWPEVSSHLTVVRWGMKVENVIEMRWENLSKPFWGDVWNLWGKKVSRGEGNFWKAACRANVWEVMSAQKWEINSSMQFCTTAHCLQQEPEVLVSIMNVKMGTCGR